MEITKEVYILLTIPNPNTPHKCIHSKLSTQWKQKEEKKQTSQWENVLYVWDDFTNERKLEFIGNRQYHITIHATNGRKSM